MNRLQKLVQKVHSLQLAAQERGIALAFPNQVKIVEMGPRDGLQNEKTILTKDQKAELIDDLTGCGFKAIEAGSFVSPKWVPQMANTDEVFQTIKKAEGVSYPVLVPNARGMESALKEGVKEIAVFAAASEGFSKKNINCSIEESLERFVPVIEAAKAKDIAVRGYVSCVMGCPYQGEVEPAVVGSVSRKLFEMGCYEISLGDTIGIGHPENVPALLDAIDLPKEKLAIHCHDTHQRGLENVMISLLNGISVVDASVAGLGGCPYAKSATGNICSENIIWVLKKLGVETGIDLPKLIEVGNKITASLNRESESLVTFESLSEFETWTPEDTPATEEELQKFVHF